MKDLDIEFDMWVPMLISFVGKTYVDTTPTLLWRQHENNSSGNYLQRKTLGYLIKKILKLCKWFSVLCFYKIFLFV